MVIISPILERDLTKGDVIWNTAGGYGCAWCWVLVYSLFPSHDAHPETTYTISGPVCCS